LLRANGTVLPRIHFEYLCPVQIMMAQFIRFPHLSYQNGNSMHDDCAGPNGQTALRKTAFLAGGRFIRLISTS
jgi:hypothetical protein